MRTLIPWILILSGCSNGGAEVLQRIEHARSSLCDPDTIASVQAFVRFACSTPDAPPVCPKFEQHAAQLPNLCATEIQIKD